jgi:hypothetical protein
MVQEDIALDPMGMLVKNDFKTKLNGRFTPTQSKFEGWPRDIQLAYKNKTWVLGDQCSKI